MGTKSQKKKKKVICLVQEKSALLNPVAIELEKEEWLLGKGVMKPNTEGGKSVSQVICLPRE